MSSALCASIDAGRHDSVGMLVGRESNADAPCAEGATPLVLAARSGDELLVRILLESGAGPTVATRSGDTSLIAAASRGHISVVRTLLAAGADLDQRGEHKTTALMAAAGNGRLEVATLLLDSGANPLHRDASSQRAAELARAGRHDTVVAELESRRPGWKSWIGLKSDP